MKLKNIKYLFFLFFTVPWLMGCNDDWLLNGNGDDLNGELPVEFSIVMPDSDDTRGFTDTDVVKKQFSAGDIIHILGTFNIKYLNEDGSTSEGVISRYGALSYVDSKGGYWTPVSGSTLTWPAVAVDGKFHAYYISKSNGVLTDKTPEETYSLSSVTPNSDPLESFSEEGIPYGYGVNLNFSHLCSYLSLENIQPMVATEYWFYPEIEKEADETTAKEFNNAFRIMLGKDASDQPTLGFEFCQLPDDQYNNPITKQPPFVYISAPQVIQETVDADGFPTEAAHVGFFLEPAYYEKFSLCYPALKPDTYSYLTYDFNNIPENAGGVQVENKKPNLLANTTYSLSVTKSPGVTIVIPPKAGGWDDDGQYFDVDVEAFLKAVYDKEEYTESGVKILEKTPNGCKLLHNVSFKYYDYAEFDDKNFAPNIQSDAVFDGNYHYINELAWPLFRYNYGTIQNLGIQEINIQSTTYESKFEEDIRDMSRIGALCRWNRGAASISNVRVSDVNMDIAVNYRNDDDDGSETHNIGLVVGSNTGSMKGVNLGGNLTLNVKGSNTSVDASVLIGGITGQNAATASIYDVSPLNEITINIKNSCQGEFGSYSMGGVAGESTGNISGVVLSKVTIDGSASKGVTSYIGGIGGKLEVSEGSTATVSSCIVSGQLKAGITQPAGAIQSKSYLGGIAGSVLSTGVTDCRTAMSIIGSPQAWSNVLYGTGGAFGRINTAPDNNYNFDDIIAYGSQLSAPQDGPFENARNYVGNFAGIAPIGMTESTFTDKNIIVHSFTGVNFIGENLSEQQ